MKMITINVDYEVYQEFQNFGQKCGKSASELIRDAMDHYRQENIPQATSIFDGEPLEAGKQIKPLSEDDDLLGEMLS